MNKRKERVLQEKKLFSSGKLIVISIGLVIIIVFGFLLSNFLLQTQEVKFSLKAAIIDQIGRQLPSSEFSETGFVTDILKSAGFNVSYHKSETVTVDFYKGLAKYDYGIIIVRGHSATREGKTIVDFFTSEEFTPYEHVSERDNGWLTKGYYEWEPEKSYFAIAPKFIEDLEGCFPRSIVVAMGCNSLNETCTEMAEAFTKRGAEAYIGWTGLVQPSHTDNETVRLLEQFLVQDRTLGESVDALKRDPLYGGRMEYYPLEAGNLTISSLIAEVKNSSYHQSPLALFEPILNVCVYKVVPKNKRSLNLAYVKLAC